MRKIENINYAGVTSSKSSDPCYHLLDIYLPDHDEFPTFLYFHGGGLIHGDKSNQNYLGDWFANRGIAFISANYRMYPQAKYPEFIDDAAEAVAWVMKNISNYGGNGKIFVGGSSAGGYLSMMLCFDGHYLQNHGILPEEISGYIHDAGQPTTHFNVLRERGIDHRRVIIDDAAPLFHIGRSDKYAPMMIIVADNDMKNRYEQTMLTESTLRHFEYDMSTIELKIMKNCTHTSYVSQFTDDGESVFGAMISDFIKKF